MQGAGVVTHDEMAERIDGDDGAGGATPGVLEDPAGSDERVACGPIASDPVGRHREHAIDRAEKFDRDKCAERVAIKARLKLNKRHGAPAKSVGPVSGPVQAVDSHTNDESVVESLDEHTRELSAVGALDDVVWPAQAEGGGGCCCCGVLRIDQYLFASFAGRKPNADGEDARVPHECRVEREGQCQARSRGVGPGTSEPASAGGLAASDHDRARA